MADRRIEWIEQRVKNVRAQLSRFDGYGDLRLLSSGGLLELANLLDRANQECLDIVDEFERRKPSEFWFWINTVGGFVGLALMDPTLISVALTIGGALGAGKSVYDRAAYLITEQRYLDLYWAVQHRKNALGSELTRRGLPWTTSP